MAKPISTKPYLIRAIYEWCTDCGHTPYLVAVVDGHTYVPREHVKNGEIVLNISGLATNQLQLGNEFIEFRARFNGVSQQISIPVINVSAIYARESGHGMAFEVNLIEPAQPEVTESTAVPPEIKLVHEQPSLVSASLLEPEEKTNTPKKKPQLTIVK